VRREIVSRHPRILLVWHPLFNEWQVYETRGTGTEWTAERLQQAIVSNHAHADREAPVWFRTDWWKARGAPVLVDTLPPERPPDSWLLDWLGERDMHCTGGITPFLRRYEERLARRKRERQARLHDKHRGLSDDLYRHARDALDRDPMAGKRKWVQGAWDVTSGTTR
jgi:hypothetical protein